jgi:adenylate kinase
VKRRIALLGAPASGKGTQAEMIESRYQIPITSPGAMLRDEKRRQTPLGLESAQLTSQGKLLPDEIIVRLTETWLDAHDSQFILDGFPRTVGQADALEAMLAKRGTPLEVALALEADLATLQKRVASRMFCLSCRGIVSVGLHVQSAASPCPRCGGVLARRDDDSPETLAARLIEYEEKTAPLIAYYEQRGLLRRIDSTHSPDLVFQSVLSILEA